MRGDVCPYCGKRGRIVTEPAALRTIYKCDACNFSWHLGEYNERIKV